MGSNLKIKADEMQAIWEIEKERAGCNALVGTKVRIDIQQLNPMLRAPVIVPIKESQNDEKFMQVFGKVKPRVVAITGDLVLCSMGIMARKTK